MDEPQQRGIRLGSEADCPLVVAVTTLEDDDDDVVPVDDVGAQPTGVFHDPHPEPAGVLEQRRQPLVVLAEAAELVVVLTGHVARQDEHVERMAHARCHSVFVEKAASKAAAGGVIALSLRTSSSASGAPCRRSMPASSHSTEVGPS